MFSSKALIFINCIIGLLASSTGFAQSKTVFIQNNYGFQTGFSIKAIIELNFTKKYIPKNNFRIVASAGIASNFLNEYLHPSVNADLMLYNGGFGSSREKDNLSKRITLDAILAFTLTGGVHNYFTGGKNTNRWDKNIPLYYFSDFGRAPLQNPYKYSLSLGSNIILTTDKGRKNQRVGFLNIHALNYQASYYNDGGPIFTQLNLGDKKDRYYTSGVIVSYHTKPSYAASLIELSWHKFTGYSKNAFELANKLQLNFVNYKNNRQTFYNKSMWTIHIANASTGFGITYKQFNRLSHDLQHKVHFAIFNGYHMVPYDAFNTISVSHYYTNTKTGFQ